MNHDFYIWIVNKNDVPNGCYASLNFEYIKKHCAQFFVYIPNKWINKEYKMHCMRKKIKF